MHTFRRFADHVSHPSVFALYHLLVTTIGEIIYEELPTFMKRTGKETLRVLEVGVLRNLDQDHLKGDGHSTLAFARLLKRYPGSEYVGIDLKPKEARKAVDSEGLGDFCDFYEGDSVATMAELKMDGEKFDVIYLDADNSGSATMREYLLALDLVTSPGLIMGDDMNLNHSQVHKGRVLIPFLIEDGAEYKIRQRHTPWPGDIRDILVQEIS